MVCLYGKLKCQKYLKNSNSQDHNELEAIERAESLKKNKRLCRLRIFHDSFIANIKNSPIYSNGVIE